MREHWKKFAPLTVVSNSNPSCISLFLFFTFKDTVEEYIVDQHVTNTSDDDDFLTSPDPFAARPKIPRDEFDTSSKTTTRMTSTSKVNLTAERSHVISNKSLSRSLVRTIVREAESSIFHEKEDVGRKSDKSKAANNKSLFKERSPVNDTLLEDDMSGGDDDDAKEERVRGGNQSRDDFTTPKGTFVFVSYLFNKLNLLKLVGRS